VPPAGRVRQFAAGEQDPAWGSEEHLLFGLVLVLFGSMLGVMAKGFGWG